MVIIGSLAQLRRIICLMIRLIIMALIGGMSTVLETYLFCESLIEDVWGDAIDMSDYFVDLKYPSLVRISMGENLFFSPSVLVSVFFTSIFFSPFGIQLF